MQVTVLPSTRDPVKCYVSLQDDRRANEGYRFIVDVLHDADARERLLSEALAELERVERTYKQLKELAPIFAAAKRVRRRKGERA